MVLRNRLRSGVVQQAILAFAATMIPNLFQFVFHFAMTRQLGVERYGALSSLLSLLVIASIPASIMATIVAKYASEFHALDDHDHLRGLAQRVLLGGGALAVVAGLTAVALSGLVARYLHITEYVAVGLLGLVIANSLVVPALRAILQGIQNYVQFAISSTIDAFGKALFGILLVYLGFGLAGAVAGILTAGLLSLAYTIFAVFKQTSGKSATVHFDVRRLAISSSGIALSTLCIIVLGFIDQPLVKHFFGAHDAGLYGAASLSGKLLLYALGFVPLILLPKAAARASRGEALPALLRTALASEVLVAIPLLSVLALAPEIVLRILGGGAYLQAAPLLLPYGTAMAFLALTSALVAFNVGAHRFAFVLPLLAVTAAEIIAIQFFHDSILQVIQIVIATNAAGCTLVLAFSLRKSRDTAQFTIADAA